MKIPTPAEIVPDLRLECGYCDGRGKSCWECGGAGKTAPSTPDERAFAKEAARAMAEAIRDALREEADSEAYIVEGRIRGVLRRLSGAISQALGTTEEERTR